MTFWHSWFVYFFFKRFFFLPSQMASQKSLASIHATFVSGWSGNENLAGPKKTKVARKNVTSLKKKQNCTKKNISTIQQFNNSTIQQFNNSTISQFNNSTIQQFKYLWFWFPQPKNFAWMRNVSAKWKGFRFPKSFFLVKRIEFVMRYVTRHENNNKNKNNKFAIRGIFNWILIKYGSCTRISVPPFSPNKWRIDNMLHFMLFGGRNQRYCFG